ncbi:serine/threonine-protein kinase [Pseudoxanthomonas japonensis]|uniref:serine/threonine-protein kinase n=1 Tax=Pseudoxanthomonas japonensis TaxID=69284 RepID=UPI001A59E59C|nr:serine/threonine-protein kinase [Pseudoxanthomonas japonensis]MBL8257582.1 serine/threonine protein kinase [Pseudoxanthomonas mexicana]MDR7070828.1 serine/threonine-protein kinase [Pseudoxanthomonas japonensis]
MDVERWKRLSPLLDVLLELEPEARAEQLEILRADDPDTAREVEKLLALEEEGEGFIDQPLVDKPGQLKPGMRVGPYQLESLLGEGGMGMVWLATRADGLYQRRVALKLLRPGLADPNLRLRFTREREILARLEHRNIARLLDAGIGGEGQPYLALEYVEGVSITDYCQANNISLEERLSLFLQICEAVSHAHANLIVHRDLKPSNILVTPSGDVRLLDFGIAKLLDDSEPAPVHPRTEVRAFTLHYAAPEQVRGELVTTMTDVYSLGVVLYELIANTKPYRLRRQTDAEWEQAILAVEPLKPSVATLRTTDGSRSQCPEARRTSRKLAGDLDNIALKALQKAPEQRYPSVEAFALDLQRHIEGRPVHARPQSVGYRLHKYLVRHRWALGIGVVVATILVAALAASVWQGRQAMRETARAQAMQDFVIGLFDNASASQHGNTFDARELLAAGERRGERELAGQPRTQAELLGLIARLRLGLGDYHESLALLEKQARLLAVTEDAPDSLRLQAATQHGRVLRLLGRARQCVQAMAPMETRLRTLESRLPLRVAEFQSQSGRCRADAGEKQLARQMFDRSLDIRRNLKDDAGVAENMRDLAQLDVELGNADAGARGYRAALAYLQAHGHARHPLVIEIQRSLALLYRNRGETDAALAAFQRARDLAQEIHGPQHPITQAVRRQVAAIHVDLGELRKAEAELRELHALTLRTVGPEHRDAAASWNSLGIIAWERGDYDSAVRDVGHAVTILRQLDNRQLLPSTLFNYGMVLHSAHREDEALAILLEARQIRVEQIGASHPLIGETDRMIGEVLAAQGDLQGATERFDRAVRLTRVGFGPDHPRTWFSELSMVHHLTRLGRPQDAIALLQPLATHQGGGSEAPKLRWLARAYIAEARCRLDEKERARRELDALAGELRAALPDGGVIPHEIAELRAACR